MTIRRLSFLLILGGFLSGSGCATSPHEKHPEYGKIQTEVAAVVKRVRTTEGPHLFANLNLLVAFDVFAVDQVVELCEDPNPRLRSNAAWILARIDDRDDSWARKTIDRALRRGLKDYDRLVRYESAAGLIMRNDWGAIPVMFEGMQDTDAGVRTLCHATLRDVTSQDFGFHVDGPEAERIAAVQRWESWYQEWRRQS